MSNYNDGTQPPSGGPPRRPNSEWPPDQPSQPGSPWDSPPRPPDQTGMPWQGQQPDRSNPSWQNQPPNQPANPWQSPPEPRRPYVPDTPPASGGANNWAYEHPQSPYGEDTSVMSVKDWLKCLLMLMIPCVGFIFPFMWAFGSTGNVNRRNYFRAYLILLAIGIGIYILIMIFAFIIGFSFSMPYL